MEDTFDKIISTEFPAEVDQDARWFGIELIFYRLGAPTERLAILSQWVGYTKRQADYMAVRLFDRPHLMNLSLRHYHTIHPETAATDWIPYATRTVELAIIPF